MNDNISVDSIEEKKRGKRKPGTYAMGKIGHYNKNYLAKCFPSRIETHSRSQAGPEK